MWNYLKQKQTKILVGFLLLASVGAATFIVVGMNNNDNKETVATRQVDKEPEVDDTIIADASDGYKEPQGVSESSGPVVEQDTTTVNPSVASVPMSFATATVTNVVVELEPAREETPIQVAKAEAPEEKIAVVDTSEKEEEKERNFEGAVSVPSLKDVNEEEEARRAEEVKKAEEEARKAEEEARALAEAEALEQMLHSEHYEGNVFSGANTYPWQDDCPEKQDYYVTYLNGNKIGGYVCECVSYAGWKAYEAWGIPLGWGHAYSWDDGARADGRFYVDHTPAAKTIGQVDGGAYGHVFWVESVNPDGSVNVTEYNNAYATSLYSGVYRYGDFGARMISANEAKNYNYIHLR